MNCKKTSGFTLIELSIVLVIIGLLVGGVLVGKDLIDAAGVRAQIKQLESYKLALNDFKLKYDCLPGDCVSATALGLGGNGNGNGILEMNDISACWWITDNNYSEPDCSWNGEFPLFFQHLSAAQMVGEIFDGTWELGKGYPKLAINNSVGMIAAGGWGTSGIGTTPDYLSRDYGFPNANGYWLHLKVCNFTNHSSGALVGDADEDCGTLTPSQAYQIDTKIDDGKPLSGIFWGYTASYAAPPSDYCLNGGYTTYNLSTGITACEAAYRMN